MEWQSVAPQRVAFLPVLFSQYSNHDDSPVEGFDHLEVPLAFLTYVIEQVWFKTLLAEQYSRALLQWVVSVLRNESTILIRNKFDTNS